MSKPVEAPIKRKERPKTKVDIENNIIDWTTFYRRNIHRFIADYLKLSLFPYQMLLVYLMSLSPLVVVVCSRASAKSYTTTVFAVATCILYPNSKVVVTAFTKKQGSLLIKEKLEKELLKQSPVLKLEIKEIKTGQNDIEVTFRNGSTFVACVAGENALPLYSNVH